MLKNSRLLKLLVNAELCNVGFLVAQEIYCGAEKNRTFVGPGFAGDDVHHGGFICTVGANNAMQFVRCNVQAELVDGLKTIKADTNVFKVQNVAASDVSWLA